MVLENTSVKREKWIIWVMPAAMWSKIGKIMSRRRPPHPTALDLIVVIVSFISLTDAGENLNVSEIGGSWDIKLILIMELDLMAVLSKRCRNLTLPNNT